MNLFTELPIATIATLGGWAAFGVLAIVGLFSNQRRKRNIEDDQTAANLIANLRTTVDVQEKTIAQMRTDATVREKESREETHALRDQLNQMIGRNTFLEELFKGRDPLQQKMFEQAPAIFELVKDNHKMSQENGVAIANLTTAITELIKSITPPKTP